MLYVSGSSKKAAELCSLFVGILSCLCRCQKRALCPVEMSLSISYENKRMSVEYAEQTVM